MQILRMQLETASLEALALFYGEVLALPVKHAEHSIHISCGTTRLIFSAATGGKAPFYHFAINIPHGSIEAAAAWMQDKAELLYMEDYKNVIAEFVNWNARSLYFLDPAGNIVELIARQAIGAVYVEPFSSAQFLGVSEAGIVVQKEAIESFTKNCLEQYGLDYFARQKPFPFFKAVGDDEGLLIIVAEGRHWYPTSIPSELSPMHIVFNLDGEEYELRLH